MRPKTAESVPERVWEILASIRQIIEALPASIEFPAFLFGVRVDPKLAVSNGIPNCHVIAHAIATVLPVEVHNGFVSVFGSKGERRRLEHSWLTLHDCDPSVIIDPWPLGVATGPAVFIQDYAFHFGPECSFLAHRDEEFLAEVEAVVLAIKAGEELSTH